VKAVWGLLVLLGILAFVLGATSADASRAWAIYLVNLVFWSGLAVTGPAIGSMMQLTEARWSPSVRRISLTTIGFLPVAFVLLVVLFLGRAALYPWVTEPIPAKAAWLNTPFFVTRTLGLAAALFLTCFAFARALMRDAVPPDDERERAHRNRLAVILLFMWIITVSLWGFDLVMSLDPRWYSGLFGGYFVVSTLYTTFCLLSILTVRANARGLASIPPAAVQDVAKLQFAMSVMWMYFFWSQYLVIWYGNVPVETRFFVRRLFVQPWQTLAWVVLVVGWLIPFAYLLKRLTGRPPQRHAPLVVVAVFGLVAIFLERVFVVFPSVSPQNTLPIGLRDIAITVGFLASFMLSRRWFMTRFKPVLNLPHTGH
jgi:Ni/Fe-hydrogenase subunit HybB-like protein